MCKIHIWRTPFFAVMREIDCSCKNLNFLRVRTQTFQRVGIFINPDWLFNYTITGNTIQNPVELETIWDSIQRTIQQEKRIKEKNRIGKEHWLQLLREAICYDEQQAYSDKTPLVNYDKAIMYFCFGMYAVVSPVTTVTRVCIHVCDGFSKPYEPVKQGPFSTLILGKDVNKVDRWALQIVTSEERQIETSERNGTSEQKTSG